MELINFRKNNKKNMDYLKDHITEVVPFLGAGISISFGYNTWQDFLEKLLSKYCHFAVLSKDLSLNDIDEIAEYINKKEYMNAANKMDTVPNLTTAICDEIEYIIQNNKPITTENAGFLHEYLHLFPRRIYLTTNFDSVVEDILSIRFGNDLDIVFPASTYRNKEMLGLLNPIDRGYSRIRPTLYYLHGKFDKQDTIVLTDTHYDDVYGQDTVGSVKSNMRRRISRELRDLNIAYIFLFLGCGMALYEDRILKLLKEINRTAELAEYNYALLDIDEIEGMDEHDRENELALFNIRPIWYSAKKIGHTKAKEELFSYILSSEYEKYNESYNKYKQHQEKMQEKKEQIKSLLERAVILNTYEFPKKYFTEENYSFAHVEVEGRHFITDQGITYRMLDKVFELSAYDVRKNLEAICNEHHANMIDGVIFVEIEDWEKIKKKNFAITTAKYELFTVVSFMDSMRIFYK